MPKTRKPTDRTRSNSSRKLDRRIAASPEGIVERYYRKKEHAIETSIEKKYMALARKTLGLGYKKRDNKLLSLVDALAILGIKREEAKKIFKLHFFLQGFRKDQLDFFVKDALEDFDRVCANLARKKAISARRRTSPYDQFSDLSISLPYSQRLRLVDKKAIFKPSTLAGIERMILHTTGKKRVGKTIVDTTAEIREEIIITRAPQLVFVAEQGIIFERIVGKNNTITYRPLLSDSIVSPYFGEREFIGGRTAAAYLGISLTEFEKFVQRNAFREGEHRFGPEEFDTVTHYSLEDINKLKKKLLKQRQRRQKREKSK